METAPTAPDSVVGERRQHLVRDLNAADVSVRRAAEQRLPGFLNAAFHRAMTVLHNRQDAHDIVSEALARWLESPGKYNENYKANDLTWFKKVVENLAVDRFRRYMRQLNILANLPPDGDDTLAQLLTLLHRSIQALSPIDRRVLELYLSWDDAPHPGRVGVRLAAELGVSDKKAKAMFAAALTALRLEMSRRSL